MQNGFVNLVGEVHIFELQIPINRSQRDGAAGLVVFFLFCKNLAGTIKAGNGLGELGADIHHLENRRNHERQKHGVGEVIAEG